MCISGSVCAFVYMNLHVYVPQVIYMCVCIITDMNVYIWQYCVAIVFEKSVSRDDTHGIVHPFPALGVTLRFKKVVLEGRGLTPKHRLLHHLLQRPCLVPPRPQIPWFRRGFPSPP